MPAEEVPSADGTSPGMGLVLYVDCRPLVASAKRSALPALCSLYLTTAWT
jgi:hypothetical protein